MENADNRIMGTEKIPSLMIRMAIPSVIAQVINILYNIVDRIYIGHISGVGAAALTGVGLTFPIITLISAFPPLWARGELRWLPSGWGKMTRSMRKRS